MSQPSTIWVDLLGCEVAQRYYDVDGVRTRCLEAGTGPALLFLHGAGGHAETWVRNLPALSAHFRCLAIDMVGHGFTDAPDHLRYTTADLVDHALRFLDAAGVERANFCGESLGGRVSAQVAIHHPDRIARLVLNTTGGLPVDEDHQQADVDVLLARMNAALDDPTDATIRARMEWLMADHANATDELVRVRQTIYRRPDTARALRKLFSLVFDPDDNARYVLTPDRLATITAPTLVVWSDRNPIHSFEDARRHLSHVPDVRFELIEGAAHWPQYEQSAPYNARMLRFLLDGD